MAKKVVKIFISAVVLFFCGLIILRCCVSADRSTLSDLLVNDSLRAAYTEEAFEVFCLAQDAAEISPDGYFSAYAFRYIPSCRQLQVTVRYNRSVYGYMQQPEGTALQFYLCKNGDTATLQAPDQTETHENALYRYQRLVFHQVDIGEDNWQIYLDLFDGTYSVSSIRYSEQPLESYSLTRGEKAALQS